MPPQDVWTNFTTTNTGEIPPMLDYNTTIPTYYNSPIEDKINVTVEGGGYFNTLLYGRRFFISSTSGEQAFIRQLVIDMVGMGKSIISAIIVAYGHHLHIIVLHLLPTI